MSEENKFIIQHNTENVSFVEMYKELKELGVENNKFFLRLYDESLMDVDLYDENNNPLPQDDETQVRILNEIVRNPWYYLREVVRIPVPGGKVKFKIHRGNLASVWAMLMNLNFFLILPRQNFKTISTIVVYSWFFHFATTHSEISFGNKKLGDSKKNIQRFKNICEQLPDYLIVDHEDDKDNITMQKSGKNDNTIEALPSAGSVKKADKIGRGATQPLQWWDEFAFLEHNKTIYEASAPAQMQAMEEAKKNGKPYGKVVS